MSHLVQAKTAAFKAKFDARAQNPEFQARQAAHELAAQGSNAELTALLAAHKEAGTVPTGAELQRFPSLGESPLEVLSREIYGELGRG
jgi:hypothetical protein